MVSTLDELLKEERVRWGLEKARIINNLIERQVSTLYGGITAKALKLYEAALTRKPLDLEDIKKILSDLASAIGSLVHYAILIRWTDPKVLIIDRDSKRDVYIAFHLSDEDNVAYYDAYKIVKNNEGIYVEGRYEILVDTRNIKRIANSIEYVICAENLSKQCYLEVTHVSEEERLL